MVPTWAETGHTRTDTGSQPRPAPCTLPAAPKDPERPAGSQGNTEARRGPHRDRPRADGRGTRAHSGRRPGLSSARGHLAPGDRRTGGTHPQRGGPPDTCCPRSRRAPNLAGRPHLETTIRGLRWGRPCRTARLADVRVSGSGRGGRSGEQGGRASRGPRGNRVTAGGGTHRGPRRCPVSAGHGWRARQLRTPGCARSSGAGGGATSPPRLEAGSAGAKNSPGWGLRAAARALSVPVCLSCVSHRPLPLALATPLRPGPADGGQGAPPSPLGTRLGPLGSGTGMRWPGPSRGTVAWARPSWAPSLHFRRQAPRYSPSRQHPRPGGAGRPPPLPTPLPAESGPEGPRALSR